MTCGACTNGGMCVGTRVHALLLSSHCADTLTIQQAGDHTLISVEFHILSTLPSENPTVVRRECVTRQHRGFVSDSCTRVARQQPRPFAATRNPLELQPFQGPATSHALSEPPLLRVSAHIAGRLWAYVRKRPNRTLRG